MDHRNVIIGVLCGLLSLAAPVGAQSPGGTTTIPPLLLQQVEDGNADVAYFIAKMFFDGSGEIEIDLTRAQEWFAKAAQMGHVYGMFELAELLYDQENYSEAKDWYQRAAEQGHGDAYYKLSYFSIYGHADTPVDCQAAYRMLDEAQLRDVRSAFNDHAWMLATLPEKSCRNGERAWRIFSRLEAQYGNDEPMPWAYWDTKAAVLAEISEFNDAVDIQAWVVSSVCDIESPDQALPLESADATELDAYIAAQDMQDYCVDFIKRLHAFKHRNAWREALP